ncbi:MAG: flagellar biosynthetic protein FliR [Aquificota bacterium]|nr:flagellar biosynthetic protein FliR [Aquificota bacterium]
MFLPQQPQTTVLAGFSTLIASTLFLSLGGAEAVYIGLAQSFKSVPIGGFDLFSLNGKVFLTLFYKSFFMGVKIALPVLIAAMLTNIILAVIKQIHSTDKRVHGLSSLQIIVGSY